MRVLQPGHPYAADVVDAARRAALVDDVRLARVLDVGESNGVTYIVSEHIQGRGLAELLQRGPLPAETVRRIVGEAAQALDRAGVRGLHHLRLSPANIVIVPDGSVKLIGTAIEAAVAGAESNDSVVANRADAIGLVSILYAGLTGRWPGVSDGPLGPAPRVTGRAVPPGELVAGVPNDLDTLCTVTLGPHEDGPRSPGELAEQLSPWGHVAPLTDPRGMSLTPGRPMVVDPVAGLIGSTPRDGVPAEPADEVEDSPVESSAPDVDQDAAPDVVAESVESAASDDETAPSDDDAASDESSDAVVDEADEGEDDEDDESVKLTQLMVSRPPAVPEPEQDDVVQDEAAQDDAAQDEAALETIRTAPPTGPMPVLTPAAARSEADTPQSIAVPTAFQQPAPQPVQQPVQQPAPQPVTAGAQQAARPRAPWRARVTDLERGDEAWPMPSAAAARTTVVTPPGTPLAGAGPADLADEILGDASGPGMLRMPPAPPPALGQATDLPWSGGGWGGWGANDQAAERLGPFMPPVPISRPPKDQARLVIAVVAALVVLGLILAVVSFWSFLSPASKGGSVTTRTTAPAASATATGAAGNASSPVSPLPTGTVNIAGVKALDPQGDNRENGASAAKVIDGDPTTTWRSEGYQNIDFGGTGKQGIGLLLDLGSTTTVSSVSLDYKGSGGTVEVRSSTSQDLGDSTVLATGSLDSGHTDIRLASPASTRYLILWFTKLCKVPGEKDYRLVVGEVDAR